VVHLVLTTARLAGGFGDGAGHAVTLAVDAAGGVSGRLRVHRTTFGLRGKLSRSGREAYGFVLSAGDGSPVALWRAHPHAGGLVLHLDVPEVGRGRPGPRPPSRLVLRRRGGWSRGATN
jgi:hypothetical protein